jgi:TPR repeat protein
MKTTRGRWFSRTVMTMFVSTLFAWILFDASGALAQTRRAFVLGIRNYTDLQSLVLPEWDVSDIAAELEQVGFDKKNIAKAVNLRAKTDFDKQFNTFLATIKEGDIVFFYYSGHGVGLESNNTNYLLMGGMRSLFTFARDKLPLDRRSDEVVHLKMTGFASDYENEEIAKNGVSVQDVIAAIGKKKPRIAILMLDACRALVQSTVDETETLRGATSGSRLLPASELPQGTIVVYSASFGESAIEKFYPNEKRRNSLFTEVVRSEMQRPGQTLIEFAERISLMVRRYAVNGGKQQVPEYFQNLGSDDRFSLVDSVGGEKFALKQEQCEGAKEDWDDISRHPEREAIERHQTRYHDCPTAELARRALLGLLASSQDPTPAVATSNKQLDDCDRRAAADNDTARPPEVAGVPLDKITDYEAAVDACDKSIKRNPRVPRFLYNLGRAELANATYNEDLDDSRRAAKLKEAKAAFSDAAERGYVAAIFGLATFFDSPDETAEERASDDRRLTQAAEQQYAPAMYELALRYSDGSHGKDQDINQAYQWMIKAAEAGYTKAMVGAAKDLFYGSGVRKNPRRAVEWAVRAANSGSVEAKFRLGSFYSQGMWVYDPQTNEKLPNSLERDYTQALLWWGRAAEDNVPGAQYNLGYMMERGWGLPGPQPEIAEKYYRLAAHGGWEDAEFELARRLRAGVMLAKPENGDSEALDLLHRALSHGSARAAETLAEIYRDGELGVAKDPVKAIQYAFEAIKLSVLADPTTDDGNPFHELQAGILIAEMAANNQAVDVNGHLLLKPDELERLQKFYGTIDPDLRRVKFRSFEVPLTCYGPNSGWFIPRQLWVWDWGRQEAPTEPQFRNLERQTACPYNDVLRQTLIAAFEAARKNKVAFADLVEEEVHAARLAKSKQ